MLTMPDMPLSNLSLKVSKDEDHILSAAHFATPSLVSNTQLSSTNLIALFPSQSSLYIRKVIPFLFTVFCMSEAVIIPPFKSFLVSLVTYSFAHSFCLPELSHVFLKGHIPKLDHCTPTETVMETMPRILQTTPSILASQEIFCSFVLNLQSVLDLWMK